LEQRIADICSTYQELINIGGRPSAPINHDPGVCDPSKSDVDKAYHVSDHWSIEGKRVEDDYHRWVKFRKYQDHVRIPKLFGKYIESVRKFLCDERIEWSVQLDRERQTKLDEWKEFYIHERRRHQEIGKKYAQLQTLPKSEVDMDSLWRYKIAFESLPATLDWIEAQLAIVDAEMVASNQITQKARVRSRTKTLATGQQSIWRDRLRPRRTTVATPQKPRTAVPAREKPQGVVKRSGTDAQKRKRQTATTARVTRSSRRKTGL
jgi:hypothetical protein